jgi:hypothetical protein
MNSVLNIYIPRILSNVDKDMIYSTMKNTIGELLHIDMYKRKNEKKQPYFIAFLSLKLNDSELANNVKNTLHNNGIAKFIYNEKKNLYWELKPYVERAFRNSPSPVSVTQNIENDNDNNQIANFMSELLKRDYIENNIVEEKVEFSSNWFDDLNLSHAIYDHILQQMSNNDKVTLLPSNFNKEDKENLEKEYNMIEKEVFKMCC